MVKEKTKDDVTYFLCGICNFAYDKKELAQKCENFCKKNKCCNMELAKKAIRL